MASGPLSHYHGALKINVTVGFPFVLQFGSQGLCPALGTGRSCVLNCILMSSVTLRCSLLYSSGYLRNTCWLIDRKDTWFLKRLGKHSLRPSKYFYTERGWVFRMGEPSGAVVSTFWPLRYWGLLIHTHVLIYTHEHTLIHVHTHDIYTHTCLYTHTCTFTLTCTHPIDTYTPTHSRTHPPTHILTYLTLVYRHLHIHFDTCTHPYIHI